MPRTGEHAHVLPDDYHYWVADERGVRHDLGSLVNAVLSIRRRAAERHGERPPAVATSADIGNLHHDMLPAALESGFKHAIRHLCGEAAEQAFSAHCAEVERFLRDTDTARH